MKAGKQYANRKIRRKLKQNPDLEISNGRYYRHLGIDSWDLWEYKFKETEEDVIHDWEDNQKRIANGVPSSRYYQDFTFEEAIQHWKKCYLRK
jgi:hypothetical protein